MTIDDIEFPETYDYVNDVLEPARAVPRQVRRRTRPLNDGEGGPPGP